MGITYLWDTNIVVYYLQDQLPPKASLFIQDIIETSSPCISAITEMELLSWVAPTKADQDALDGFLKDIRTLDLTTEIKQLVGYIRQTYRVKLPDAAIAATAIAERAQLLTRNTKDFTHIDGVYVINPFDFDM